MKDNEVKSIKTIQKKWRRKKTLKLIKGKNAKF
jgi:hypothetical protein